jgi:hypothetical protein
MKKALMTLLFAALSGLAFAHGPVELGPNKGRILEFSKNESMHGEVTIKDGNFLIALLDKDMKPVKIEAQSLTATGGTREKPKKIEVTKKEDKFVLPMVKEGEWLILQFKEKDSAEPITARVQYEKDAFFGHKH